VQHVPPDRKTTEPRPPRKSWRNRRAVTQSCCVHAVILRTVRSSDNNKNNNFVTLAQCQVPQDRSLGSGLPLSFPSPTANVSLVPSARRSPGKCLLPRRRNNGRTEPAVVVVTAVIVVDLSRRRRPPVPSFSLFDAHWFPGYPVKRAVGLRPRIRSGHIEPSVRLRSVSRNSQCSQVNTSALPSRNGAGSRCNHLVNKKQQLPLLLDEPHERARTFLPMIIYS
jgi:hypothetical protein